MTLDAGPDASRDGHFGWYRALDKQERRAFWSCKIGYGLRIRPWVLAPVSSDCFSACMVSIIRSA